MDKSKLIDEEEEKSKQAIDYGEKILTVFEAVKILEKQGRLKRRFKSLKYYIYQIKQIPGLFLEIIKSFKNLIKSMWRDIFL